jgi:catechol 2,3-dioxygenase-like lactoylglutathione lyase family enzyme
MIDHVDIRVSDLSASRRFYESALEPLGFHVVADESDPNGGAEIGFGNGPGGEVWFALHEPTPQPGQDTITVGAHIAFVARGPDEVAAFHRCALTAGGRNLGNPGPRPEYSEGYFGAFVLDPDGNNVEAVCQTEPPATLRGSARDV